MCLERAHRAQLALAIRFAQFESDAERICVTVPDGALQVPIRQHGSTGGAVCGSGKICVRERDGLPYSRFTSRGLLSSRSATNFEGCKLLAPVHSRNSNCPTSTGA